MKSHASISRFNIICNSLLPVARNKVIESINYDDGELTHILFIDADMAGYIPAHLQSMIERDVPIIGPVATYKQPPYNICVDIKDKQTLLYELNKQDTLSKQAVEIQSIGMSFTLVKVEVLEAIKEMTSDGPVWFRTDRFHRPTIHEERDEAIERTYSICTEPHTSEEECKETLHKLFQLGIDAHRGTPLLGEDIVFCAYARLAGYKIYVDPRVCIQHIGFRPASIFDNVMWHKMQNIIVPETEVPTIVT